MLILLATCSVWDATRHPPASLLGSGHQEPVGSLKQLDVKGIFFSGKTEGMCTVHLCLVSPKLFPTGVNRG